MRTNSARLSTFASVLILSLGIAGCGGTRNDGNGMPRMPEGGSNGGEEGDGGGPGGMTGDPDVANGGPEGMTGDPDVANGGPEGMTGDPEDGDGGPGIMSGDSVAEAQGVAASGAPDAAAIAATAEPAFGSVTQSTNTDSSGVTTDTARASLSFEQGVPRLIVDVSRQGESNLRIESAGDDVDGLDSTPSSLAATGRTARFAVPLEFSTSDLTLAFVEVDWSSSDPADYMAYGTWINVTGDFSAGVVDAASIGAFVDGPEIRGTPDLPVTGTATYNGPAEGMYGAEYGTDAHVPAGSVEIGFFAGDTTLTADFGANTISGMVDDVSLVGVTVTPSGEEQVFDADTDYELHMGATSLHSNGRFTGTNATLYRPGITFTSNAGSWGGKFSTMEDGDGNPRLVAGTVGGNGTTSGGTSASFVGAFVGTTEHFQ